VPSTLATTSDFVARGGQVSPDQPENPTIRNPRCHCPSADGGDGSQTRRWSELDSNCRFGEWSFGFTR
jgi:hypothetical protein